MGGRNGIAPPMGPSKRAGTRVPGASTPRVQSPSPQAAAGSRRSARAGLRAWSPPAKSRARSGGAGSRSLAGEGGRRVLALPCQASRPRLESSGHAGELNRPPPSHTPHPVLGRRAAQPPGGRGSTPAGGQAAALGGQGPHCWLVAPEHPTTPLRPAFQTSTPVIPPLTPCRWPAAPRHQTARKPRAEAAAGPQPPWPALDGGWEKEVDGLARGTRRGLPPILRSARRAPPRACMAFVKLRSASMICTRQGLMGL